MRVDGNVALIESRILCNAIWGDTSCLKPVPDFKGYIHDVGGPTANFRHPSCHKQLKVGVCPNRECLGQNPCPNLEADHTDYIALLRKLRAIPGIKKVFVRSGIRFAPEHVADHVLALMGKPKHEVFMRFKSRYERVNRKFGMEQYLVPYFISSHPGCTLDDAIELAEYFRDTHSSPEQVQDFYPSPGTLSTCMFYTGLDPRNMKPIYIAKDPREKELQRALMQYRFPENAAKVREALRKAGRTDLIGNGPKCLVKAEQKKETSVHNTSKLGKKNTKKKGEHIPKKITGREKK